MTIITIIKHANMTRFTNKMPFCVWVAHGPSEIIRGQMLIECQVFVFLGVCRSITIRALVFLTVGSAAFGWTTAGNILLDPQVDL